MAERLLKISPDYAYAYELLARCELFGDGDLAGADSVLEAASLQVDPVQLVGMRVTLDLCRGRAQRALEQLLVARETEYYTSDSALYFLGLGEAHAVVGEDSLSRAAYGSAREIIEQMLLGNPEEAQYHSMLGVACAGLGVADSAVYHGRYATELCPIEDDALTGASWRHNLAVIYTLTGQHDEALSEIRFLLSVPSEMTVEYLKLHPSFEALRMTPGMRSLLAEARRGV